MTTSTKCRKSADGKHDWREGEGTGASSNHGQYMWTEFCEHCDDSRTANNGASDHRGLRIEHTVYTY